MLTRIAKMMAAAATLAVAGFAHPPPAEAQVMRCAQRDTITGFLGEHFGERLNAMGVLNGDQALIEIYASHDGRFTILLTRTNGASCMIAAGYSWEFVSDLTGAAMRPLQP